MHCRDKVLVSTAILAFSSGCTIDDTYSSVIRAGDVEARRTSEREARLKVRTNAASRLIAPERHAATSLARASSLLGAARLSGSPPSNVHARLPSRTRLRRVNPRDQRPDIRSPAYASSSGSMAAAALTAAPLTSAASPTQSQRMQTTTRSASVQSRTGTPCVRMGRLRGRMGMRR